MDPLYRVRSIQPLSAVRFRAIIGAVIGGIAFLIGLVFLGINVFMYSHLSVGQSGGVYLGILISVAITLISSIVTCTIIGLVFALVYNRVAEHLGYWSVRLKQ